MVAFNYRRVPAVASSSAIDRRRANRRHLSLARCVLARLDHRPRLPHSSGDWKKDKAGSGPHGDLNAHIIDLALHLVGDIDSVVGADTTFIKERPLLEAVDGGLGAQGGEQMGQVTVDDATMFLARFQNGAPRHI